MTRHLGHLRVLQHSELEAAGALLRVLEPELEKLVQLYGAGALVTWGDLRELANRTREAIRLRHAELGIELGIESEPGCPRCGHPARDHWSRHEHVDEHDDEHDDPAVPTACAVCVLLNLESGSTDERGLCRLPAYVITGSDPTELDPTGLDPDFRAN